MNTAHVKLVHFEPHFRIVIIVVFFSSGEVAEEAKKKVSDILSKRKDPPIDGSSPDFEGTSSRPDSASALVFSDRGFFRNTPAVPDRSAASRDGPVIVRQTNYIVQDSDRSDVNSDTGSGPIPVDRIAEKVKTVERTLGTVGSKPSGISLMERGSKEQLSEVVTETYVRKVDHAGLIPSMTQRSVSLISDPSSSTRVSLFFTWW